MKTLRAGWSRLGGLIHGEPRDREFEEELASHIELEAEDNRRAGMTPEEARRAARIRLGGVESIKENVREQRGFPGVETFLRDVRYALRGMGRSPGFTAVAVMTLAIGIGVNAAVFSLTNAILFRGYALVERNDRILYVDSRNTDVRISYPDFEDWRAQAKSFRGMAAAVGLDINFSDRSGFPETYPASEVSANAFGLLGQKPIIGRDFAPSDDVPGAIPVAILSHPFWERRYGRDSSIVGQTVRINGTPTTIIGVMPQGFSFPENQDLWIPLVPTPDLQKREARRLWFAFGRLADGVTAENARAEMETIGKRLTTTYPLTNRDFLPAVQTFAQSRVGVNQTLLFESMWAAVGFVLLIACANLANLLLSRAIGRTREISMRIALGASRLRIIRQLMIESLLLSAMGGTLGWWIAKWGLRAYALSAYSGPWIDYSLDHRVVEYLIAISIGTALLFGLAPAFRFSKLEAGAVLKDIGPGITAGGCRKNLSTLLLIGEMALAVVLLTGAGTMIHSFLNIYTADLGVNTERVLAMALRFPDFRHFHQESFVSFFDRLTPRLAAIPGVESIALADRPPTVRPSSFSYELAGAPPIDHRQRPKLSALTVGPTYFRTLGVILAAGREFTVADRHSGTPVIIVNQRFAKETWPRDNPLGKRIRIFLDGNSSEAWWTIVGVVPNIIQENTRQRKDPLIYLPYWEKPSEYMWVFARTRVAPLSLANSFRREVQTLNSDLPISNVDTLEKDLEWNYRDNRINAALFLIFAAIALLLASVGLYAVIAQTVSQGTREIGIRMAVGAGARDILRLVFIQGMFPLGVGLVLGLAGAFAAAPVLKSVLVGVAPADPSAFAIASAVLILFGTLGCLIPGRRAIRVDPAVALRHE